MTARERIAKMNKMVWSGRGQAQVTAPVESRARFEPEDCQLTALATNPCPVEVPGVSLPPHQLLPAAPCARDLGLQWDGEALGEEGGQLGGQGQG